MTPIRKTKAAESPAEELGRLVDELGPLLEQLDEAAPAQKRADAIKKELRGLFDGADAAKSSTIPGKVYTAIISCRRMENTVNVLKLFKQIGVQAFLKICIVTVKALEETLPLAKREGLVHTDQSGSRTVTTALNAQASAKAA